MQNIPGGGGWGFFGPFDEDDAVLGEEFVEADGEEVFFGFDAVGVEVEDGFWAGVYVQEDVGGGSR